MAHRIADRLKLIADICNSPKEPGSRVAIGFAKCPAIFRERVKEHG